MFRKVSSIGVVVLFLAVSVAAQTGSGIIKGQVADNSGAVIPAAKVTAAGPGGILKTATSGGDGTYSLAGLAPGIWTVQATAPGLKQVTPAKVDLSTAHVQTANLTLDVVLENQEVTVQESNGPQVNTSPDSNAGSIVLKGQDLDALSDDPDEMSDDLQALAGPSAGPDGGQIYIDGFTGGTLPPKSSIREIRINQNPFSSEFDKLGYGRIEILTKPGTDTWHGSAFFNDSDGIFNARNPFSAVKPDFQSRQYGGNASGSLGKKASVFFDFERREIDDTAVVNAITLDTQLLPTPFSQTLPTPQRRTSFSPRIDYQLTPNNTLMVRYRYERNDRDGFGVGGLTLASQAYASLETEQTVQVTDTMVLNAKTINETRFQFFHASTGSNPSATTPALTVQGAFSEGGSGVGLSNDLQNHYELQNYTSYASGAHSLKYGVRMRGITDDSVSRSNYNGAYTFKSLQTYAQTLALENQGLSAQQIYDACTDPTRLSCAGPSQFTLTQGLPRASVGYVDAGVFVQDDWRMKPNFTLSLGARYEIQNNIGSRNNFAPRVGFAWAPGSSSGKSRPKTVFRGGWGMFYTRFDEGYTLDAERYNGVTQQQFLQSYPSCFPNFAAGLTANTCPLGASSGQNITTVDRNLRTPYIMQSAVGIERQLPRNTTVSVNYLDSRGVHLLLSRDINAPLPGTFASGNPVYPYASINGTGQIDQFESTGVYRQRQVMVNVNSRISRNISMFGNYSYNVAHSTADSATSLVSNPYDISADYGASSLNVHNRVFLGGSVNSRWNVRLSPFMVYQSSRPYNIVLPQDLIGDGIFNQRPSFAAAGDPGAIATPYGFLNPNPLPGEPLIPRNLGSGPGFFSLNVRLSKTFGFGPETSGTGGRGPGGGGHNHGGGLFGGGGGGFGDSGTGQRYNLTVGIQARNLFNTVNLAPPIGVVGSPLFGESNALAGGWGATSANNRRIELQLRFSF